jgi:hypothetical protein
MKDELSVRFWDEFDDLAAKCRWAAAACDNSPDAGKTCAVIDAPPAVVESDRLTIGGLERLHAASLATREAFHEIADHDEYAVNPDADLPQARRMEYIANPYRPESMLRALWNIAVALRQRARGTGRKWGNFPPMPSAVRTAAQAIGHVDTLMAWCEEHIENDVRITGNVRLGEIEAVMGKPTSKTINEHIRNAKQTDPVPPPIFAEDGKASIWRYAELLPWLRRQFPEPEYDWPATPAQFMKNLHSQDLQTKQKRKRKPE